MLLHLHLHIIKVMSKILRFSKQIIRSLLIYKNGKYN